VLKLAAFATRGLNNVVLSSSQNRTLWVSIQRPPI